MVLYTPPIQRLPNPVTPPSRDRRVAGVARVSAEATGGREADQGRSLRQRLMDMVMEEVDELPDLTQPQRERIKGNLDRYAARPEAAPSEGGGGDGEQSQPRPEPGPVDLAMEAMTRTDDAEEADPAEAFALADQMRRLLEFHSERAVKIASYIHALQTVAPEVHQVSLDI